MKFYSLLLFTTISFASFSQAPKIFADAAYIFKGLNYGGSTASLWYYSKAVDTAQNVTKIQLNKNWLDTLNYLVSQVKSKKHYQQKVGPSFYASIIKDGQERRLAIVAGWAIIDLRNKRQYVFRDTPYFEIYRRFVDRNYN